MLFAPTPAERRARARADLRLGLPVAVVSGGAAALAVSAETLTARRLAELREAGTPVLAVSARRAATLKARAYDGDLARIVLPRDLCGFLEGRSRFARLGLMIHVTSAFVQPGVRNRQVLEMSNVSSRSLRIHAGVRLCQLVLMWTDGEAVYAGRFADQDEI